MMRRAILASLVLAGSSVVFAPAVCAQGLSLDLSAGRIVYDPVSINVGTNNAMGTLRYDAARGSWVYGTAAAPLRDGDPIWGAGGAGGRFTPAGSSERRAFIGADVDAHAFLFRDVVAALTGRGGAIDAIPFAGVNAGSGRIELRGGWRGETLDFAGETENRGVFETGARAVYTGEVRVQGDLKWVHAIEGTFPFVGGSVVYGDAPLQVWARTGKWLSDQLNNVAWGVGVGAALGGQSTVWASVGQEAPDPLYWNSVRRTWSVGITRRLGRVTHTAITTPHIESDGVVIRIPVADAPGDGLLIGGDFNQWQPVPMTREGAEWTIRLPLPKGVYHYAFRTARGDWFVPDSLTGRRDDGMGGHVAVIVVM
jgi:hypothetical protein